MLTIIYTVSAIAFAVGLLIVLDDYSRFSREWNKHRHD
jgi:hypothetical protein